MTWNELLDTLTAELESWAHAGVEMLPNLAIALVVLLLAFGISRLVPRGVSSLSERLGLNPSAGRLVGRVVAVLVLVLGLSVALGVMELQRTVTSVLAGAGVVGLALGLAFQDIASNLLAGVSMSFRRPFNIGDQILTCDYEGRVVDLDLRTTRLVTYDGQDVVLPNHDVYTSGMVNYTRSKERRVDVPVGVGYDEDLDRAARVAEESVREGVRHADEDRDPEVLFTGFGGSSIDLVVRLWVTDPGKLAVLQAQSDMIRRIKAGFDEAGIGIPFPIRTIDWAPAEAAE